MDPDAADGKYGTPLTVSEFWSECCNLVVLVDEAGTHADVPDEVARHKYHQAPNWLPEKPEVRDTPCVLKDGTIADKPGYHVDPDRGLNHFIKRKPGVDYSVPDHPTAQDAETSLEYLRLELLTDFAFNDVDSDGVEGRKLGEAMALALILTPWMRFMINGVTPMFLIHKASPGEGATLLANAAGYLYMGYDPDVISYRDDGELSKEIVAAVSEDRRVMFFDDVLSLDSKVFHRSINYPTLSGRILGQSKTVSVLNDKLWIASGINPRYGKETERRIVSIRLNSKTIDPENRNFRHPDISGKTMGEFLAENRVKIVSHILTLIRYWVQGGAPLSTKAKKANFEDWARKVGGLLELVGVDGFLDYGKSSARDPQSAAHNEFAVASVNKYSMDVPINYGELYAFHRDRDGAAIFVGKKEWDREEAFRSVLNLINGKVFEVGGQTVIFSRTFDAEGTEILKFAKVTKPNA